MWWQFYRSYKRYRSTTLHHFVLTIVKRFDKLLPFLFFLPRNRERFYSGTHGHFRDFRHRRTTFSENLHRFGSPSIMSVSSSNRARKLHICLTYQSHREHKWRKKTKLQIYDGKPFDSAETLCVLRELEGRGRLDVAEEWLTFLQKKALYGR